MLLFYAVCYEKARRAKAEKKINGKIPKKKEP